MATTEQFNDWLIRYSLLYKKRYTKRQKQRFAQSFVTDLMNIRKDVEIRKDKQEKESLYIVVGDLKKAKHVIATYYDTPAVYQGDYPFFHVEKQQKQTTNRIIWTALTLLILGTLFTYFVGMPLFEQGGISYSTILLVVAYFVFFYIFGKATRGWPEKANLVRNTSSLLYLLKFIEENSDASKAYIFYDYGCQGTSSLQKVRSKLNLSKQRLTILDSIGAKGELLRVASSQQKATNIPTILSSEIETNCEYLLAVTKQSEEVNELSLDKKTLKSKEINQENYRQLDKYFS